MNTTTLGKKQIGVLVFLFILLVSLPIAVFLTRQQQDIRPRAALPGQANFKLTASDTSPDVGESFTVNASLDSTSNSVKVSGVEFRILYNKNAVEPNPTVVPAIGADKPFTDVLINEVDVPYSTTQNYIRLVLVSRRLTPALTGGTNIPLAAITFKAKTNGDMNINFPNQNFDTNGVAIMQVVGVDLTDPGPSATPTPN